MLEQCLNKNLCLNKVAYFGLIFAQVKTLDIVGIYQAEVRHLSCINCVDNEVTWGGDSKYNIQIWCKQL